MMERLAMIYIEQSSRRHAAGRRHNGVQSGTAPAAVSVALVMSLTVGLFALVVWMWGLAS